MNFGPWTWLILMENIQKPPYLHVKHKNTCKMGTKMNENTFFSQIDNILKIVSRFDECTSFSFFADSRTDFKHLYGHVLVSSKIDQIYWIGIQATLWFLKNIFTNSKNRIVIWFQTHKLYLSAVEQWSTVSREHVVLEYSTGIQNRLLSLQLTTYH